MNDEGATLSHLYGCVSSIYATLGELAPTLTNDAVVVRLYVTARAAGEVALALRARVGDVAPARVRALEAALRAAANADDTGGLLLFTWVSLVGPRVLVSLRDAREVVAGEPGRSVLDEAALVLVSEMLAGADLAHRQEYVASDESQTALGEIERHLEKAGYAESFGLSH